MPAAPVARPGKIMAVGRNYADHAAEQGVATAEDPILFTKYSSSVIADGEDIVWRAADTEQVDYEAELAVVIGTTARDVPPDRALDHVLGYTCLNDVSARDLQFGDGQWVRGKSLDTFCPTGPWIVTADDIPDPQALRIRCIVNGEVVQDASTGQMLHGVAALIAFCSRFFTLDPATSSPPGRRPASASSASRPGSSPTATRWSSTSRASGRFAIAVGLADGPSA